MPPPSTVFPRCILRYVITNIFTLSELDVGIVFRNYTNGVIIYKYTLH